MRESLAAKGISTDLSFTTVLQGVADGGANRTTKVGTSMDLGVHLDFMRMGLIPGGLLSLRAEGDFGDSVLEDAGTITAVNYNALVPVGTLDNDTATLSDLYYTQFPGEAVRDVRRSLRHHARWDGDGVCGIRTAHRREGLPQREIPTESSAP